MRLSLIIILSAFCFALATAQSYAPVKQAYGVAVSPKVPLKAYAVPLSQVKLLPGSIFHHARLLDSAYLLSLEPDRLLHRFHLHAGLPVKGEIYRGWESDGLSGHTLGHYLSACAMMYASTGADAFKQRTDYIVSELDRCQQARRTGYVGAIPNEDSIFYKVKRGIIKTAGFDLNGGWSPWYTVHKVMAGLADVYVHTGNPQALKVLKGMADWTADIVGGLTPDQQEAMLQCEYGGMNDVLVHLYELTGEKKYLDLSYRFHDRFVLDELAKQRDVMPGKHANTNIPKVTGCVRRYLHTESEADKTIGNFFWNTMVNQHTYVIGGNSNYEYCGDPGKLNDRLSDNTCETCNTYNMLKLTRMLFLLQPSARLGDYYERALYNHILASQHPQSGMMCYFVPLRMGARKTFSSPFNTFTCCVGSGMENHVKYNEGIYYEGEDGSLWVNLFIASELNLKNRELIIRQETRFPENSKVDFVFSVKKPTSLELKIRKPKWVVGEVTMEINGKKLPVTTTADGFLVISRKWKTGDRLTLNLPMNLYTESIPDNPNRIAILYGPIVLAGVLGKEMPDPVYGTTVLLTDNRNVQSWLKPIADQPLAFQTQQVARPQDVKLVPFYKVFEDYYNVYWDFFTPADWAKRQQAYEAEKKRQQEIENRTVDWIRLGEMQPERDHNLRASERSYVSQALGRSGREVRLGGYFEFDMKTDPSGPNTLMCTYIGDDRNRAFDFLVDGVKIATQELTGGESQRFFDVEYKIPLELTRGKQKVTVRVQAHTGKTAGRVFGCRVLKD
ncbi:MAG: glycoside hydrolase family 127 protein [Cyclobacteriaceae bacterium]|nr:glycoside hydrolase family 127 protein [Cyclobacteriaceae bacterium]